MLRKKITIISCCAIAAFGLGSCVTTTDEYDSLKDISLDMQIAPDGLSFPLGSLAKIRLDSLIKVKEDGVIKIMTDGTYGITMDNTISETQVSISPLTLSFPNPALNPTKANFPGLVPSVPVTGTISAPVSISSGLSLNQAVDQSLKEIKQVDLVSSSDVTVSFEITGLPSANATLILKDFVLPFPAFMKLEMAGTVAGVELQQGYKVVIANKTLAVTGTTANLTIPLKVTGLEFAPAKTMTTDSKLVLNEAINVTGNIDLDCSDVNTDDLKNVRVAPTISFAPMAVKSVTGKFDPSISPVKESVSIALGGDLDFLSSADNRLVLSDPEIVLDLNTSLTAPLKMDLSLSSKNSKGEFIAQNITPDEGAIIVPASPMTSASKKTVLVLNSKVQAASGDTIYTRISKFQSLMTTIPDSICFNLTPSIDKNSASTIDLTRELKVNGAYAVKVPLAFDTLNIVYSDTIKDLGKDLADIGGKIMGTKIQLKGFVSSTLPLGVDLTLKPFDKNGAAINGIVVNKFNVPEGNNSVPTPQPVLLEMKVNQAGALKDLDYMILEATCSSNKHSVLKNDQYLKFDGLVLKIPEGISLDLSDKDKK